MNILKKSLKKKRLLGYWSILPLSQIHEIMSEAGYEFSIVDLEHGTYSFQEALESVIAIKASGMFSLIRPSSHDSKEILRCLELNPDGICIPQVSTYEEAKNVVSACHILLKEQEVQAVLQGLQAMERKTSTNILLIKIKIYLYKYSLKIRQD